MSNTPRRWGALLATSALTLSGLTLVAAPAQAATDARPVTIATNWLQSQLTDGIVIGRYLDGDNEVTYEDFGLTMDTGLSFVETGNTAGAEAISDALAPQVVEAYESFGTTYTGSAAKAAVFAAAAGDDPENYGGVDLIALVEANTASDGPIAGRIENVNDGFGDANVFGQAFAARALAAAGSAKATDALDFLLAQQCDDGFFRLNFNADKGDPAQSCEDGVGTSVSSPDTDATAIAVLQLTEVEGHDALVTPALVKAQTWLLENQNADGSFGGGTSTEAPNANSTGLSGWALGKLGEPAAASRAAIWVRGLQADELTACPSQLSGATGAIGYDAATVADGRADGITIGSEDRWRRTTAPILPVLAYAPAATRALTLTGPSGTVKGGKIVVYQITGVVPGDKVCVTALGIKRPVVAGADGTTRVAFTMPRTSGSRTVTVRDRGVNTVAVQTSFLGAKTFAVTAPATAKRGTSVPVVVKGLAPGESVRITRNGVKVRTGFASTKGTFSTTIPVGTSTGKTVIRAFGKYADIRKGYDILTVVS